MYSKMLLSVKFKNVSLIIVSLPLFGLTFAIVWSLLFDFESSTATHCEVKNYLPSVSAAIGRTPQAYVWRACISLHSMPRYLCVFMEWNWLKIRKVKQSATMFPFYTSICFLYVVANSIELTGLFGLTIISSIENKDIHESCFIINITSFCLALYFYFRHLKYCEPGVYSIFALCEYMVIISNMPFHVTCGLDFLRYSWIVCEREDNKLR